MVGLCILFRALPMHQTHKRSLEQGNEPSEKHPHVEPITLLELLSRDFGHCILEYISDPYKPILRATCKWFRQKITYGEWDFEASMREYYHSGHSKLIRYVVNQWTWIPTLEAVLNAAANAQWHIFDEEMLNATQKIRLQLLWWASKHRNTDLVKRLCTGPEELATVTIQTGDIEGFLSSGAADWAFPKLDQMCAGNTTHVLISKRYYSIIEWLIESGHLLMPRVHTDVIPKVMLCDMHPSEWEHYYMERYLFATGALQSDGNMLEDFICRAIIAQRYDIAIDLLHVVRRHAERNNARLFRNMRGAVLDSNPTNKFCATYLEMFPGTRSGMAEAARFHGYGDELFGSVTGDWKWLRKRVSVSSVRALDICQSHAARCKIVSAQVIVSCACRDETCPGYHESCKCPCECKEIIRELLEGKRWPSLRCTNLPVITSLLLTVYHCRHVLITLPSCAERFPQYVAGSVCSNSIRVRGGMHNWYTALVRSDSAPGCCPELTRFETKKLLCAIRPHIHSLLDAETLRCMDANIKDALVREWARPEFELEYRSKRNSARPVYVTPLRLYYAKLDGIELQGFIHEDVHGRKN